MLLERGLFETFADRPDVAIAELHGAMVAAGGDPDMLFALAELSYLYGQDAKRPEYQMAAAIYAWAFLFPEDGKRRGPVRPPLPERRRPLQLGADGGLRVAGRLDGRAAWRHLHAALRTRHGGLRSRRAAGRDPRAVRLRAGRRARGRRAGHAVSLARHRRAAGSLRPLPGADPARDLVAPKLRVPVTALLRVPGAHTPRLGSRDARGRHSRAALLLWEGDSVEIGGERVPLESEPPRRRWRSHLHGYPPSTQLELFAFLGRPDWRAQEERPPRSRPPPVQARTHPRGVRARDGVEPGPLGGDVQRVETDPEIVSATRSGSSCTTPTIRSPVRAASASRCGGGGGSRPQGKDAAIRKMVVIGHSQGGLLGKIRPSSPGTALRRRRGSRPISGMSRRRATAPARVFDEPLP